MKLDNFFTRYGTKGKIEPIKKLSVEEASKMVAKFWVDWPELREVAKVEMKANWFIVSRLPDSRWGKLWQLVYEAGCGHLEEEAGSAGVYSSRDSAVFSGMTSRVCVRCWLNEWAELSKRVEEQS